MTIDVDNDLSMMDPALAINTINETIDNHILFLNKAQDVVNEASNLISKIGCEYEKQFEENNWCMLSNIKDAKNPKYYKLDDNHLKFILVDIRNAPVKCCQGCGIQNYKAPERPSVPSEIVLKEEYSTTVYVMNTDSVCADCLPDISVVTVISHAWEQRKQSLQIRSIGTGFDIVYVSKKVAAALAHINGWIWVDALCDQSSADSDMRTRMYATCKLGVFTEQLENLSGQAKGWHQRLWCLIESMYCKNIVLVVIGQIDNGDIKTQLIKLKNMYAWFYATCRLLRIHLNNHEIRQKVIHWGDTNWHSGREKAANQLSVDVSRAAIGWIAGSPSTLPGRCVCPLNACIVEAFINYAYIGTHYEYGISHHGITLDLSQKEATSVYINKKISRWCSGQNVMFFVHKTQHKIFIESATINKPSGNWYVFSNTTYFHCIETLPGELHMEKMRVIVFNNKDFSDMISLRSSYCVGN